MSRKDVGYGKPPAEHRFRKGTSGNPAGRPRKGRGDIDPLAILEADHTLEAGGRTLTLSAGELRLRKLVQRALKDKDRRAIFYLIEQFEAFDLLAAAIQPHMGNVVEMPSTMPWDMAALLLASVGPPPWSAKEKAWARKIYLVERSDEDAEHDAVMEYPDL